MDKIRSFLVQVLVTWVYLFCKNLNHTIDLCVNFSIYMLCCNKNFTKKRQTPMSLVKVNVCPVPSEMKQTKLCIDISLKRKQNTKIFTKR